MIINVGLNYSLTMQELAAKTKSSDAYISRNVMWLKNFYVKLLNNMLEINIFEPSVSQEYILYDFLQNVLKNQGKIFIRVQKSEIINQFFIDNT